MNGKTHKRALMICLCVLFALFSVVSAALAVHHLAHPCDDHACPVCLLLHATESLIKSLALLIARLRVLLMDAFWPILLSALSVPLGLHGLSLVKQNIRMNN